MTYQMMAAVLTSNGWQTLWADNNWIKSCWLDDRKINVDWAGMSTEKAFEKCMEEIEIARAQASFDQNYKRN